MWPFKKKDMIVAEPVDTVYCVMLRRDKGKGSYPISANTSEIGAWLDAGFWMVKSIDDSSIEPNIKNAFLDKFNKVFSDDVNFIPLAKVLHTQYNKVYNETRFLGSVEGVYACPLNKF